MVGYSCTFLDTVFCNEKVSIKKRLFPYLWRLLRQVYLDNPLLLFNEDDVFHEMELTYVGRMTSMDNSFIAHNINPSINEC